ncbi:hypothetical protein QVD17_24168 [Tagetes erecta]|uniref:Uncharacterized protein n=1 Tax=Tagetes erecta TaxID=13708 RepID=A0AAD8KET2_TARER|nr:hypothetical protein QVD17_24168 [Tagetes erecta]
MGACLSSEMDKSSSCAFVVTMEGELIEYPTPVFVSELVFPPCAFVCNSDCLYYEQRIPALDREEELEAGQIYFILEKTMVDRRLSNSDMAALALKASIALNSKSNKNKARISPLAVENEDINYTYRKQKPNGGSRSRKYSSKKARLASIQLSTIYENEDL